MNKVLLIGRLTRDPELKTGANDLAIARFTIAVDRRIRRDGEASADFISCVAFGKTAEFINKYFSKGKRMGLCGRIQTGSYTNKNGDKVYTTDIVVDEVEFVESKSAGENSQSTPPGAMPPSSAPPTATNKDDFVSVPEDMNEELPFD